MAIQKKKVEEQQQAAPAQARKTGAVPARMHRAAAGLQQASQAPQQGMQNQQQAAGKQQAGGMQAQINNLPPMMAAKASIQAKPMQDLQQAGAGMMSAGAGMPMEKGQAPVAGSQGESMFGTPGMGMQPEKGFRPEAQAEQQPGGAAMNGINTITNSFGQGQQVGEQQIIDAEMVLMKYKAGKRSLESRIIHNQQWWKLRNWQEIEGKNEAHGSGRIKNSTAWLWNCICGKHADFVDAYPEPIVLPRAEDDQDEAQRLSQVIPVIMEMNDFEQVYSDAQWQKLTEGTACYGCFWDKDKLNGLGDIAISRINLLNLFWEPGITNLQESRHLFLCELVDNDVIEQQYPETEGKVKGNKMTLAHYIYDDTVDTTDKSVVVDWYYHKWQDGKQILHYCKFVGHNILYATENDPEYAERGLYDDGKYPFVLDTMYPVEGSPCGMGLIDIGQGTQADIDIMNQAMVRSATMSCTPRYFVRTDGSVNEDEFADWTKPIVHVGGSLGQDAVAPIQSQPLAQLSVSFLEQKVNELKFVTGNVDVNNGSTPSGVTAASAIAALKEDAGRTSKDSSKASYRAYRTLVTMVIERIRQFYDLPRQYRIVGERGEERFEQYDNSNLQEQPQQNAFGEDMGMRLPVFDVMVRAQRENAYTKTAQNELAIQFYQLGFFNPQQADMSLMALDMMDFRGKDDLIKKLQNQQTMMTMLQQMTQLATQIAMNSGDQAALAAVQAVATGQTAQGGAQPMMQDQQAQQQPNQAKKLQKTPEGNATTGQTTTEQKVPAAKQMNKAASRVADAKSPQ